MQRRSLSRAWTEVEREEFRRMWLGGATLLKIASRLRRSKYAVERQRQLLGLPTRTEVLQRKESSRRGVAFAEARQASPSARLPDGIEEIERSAVPGRFAQIQS
jgi:hypothetical protein